MRTRPDLPRRAGRRAGRGGGQSSPEVVPPGARVLLLDGFLSATGSPSAAGRPKSALAVVPAAPGVGALCAQAIKFGNPPPERSRPHRKQPGPAVSSPPVPKCCAEMMSVSVPGSRKIVI